MQRGVERTVLHLQVVIGAALNVLADLVSMSRAPGKRAQEKHVKRAQEEIRARLCFFWHGRRSTLS